MIKMSIGSLWVRFVSIISLALTIAGLYFAWHLPLDIVLGSTTLLFVIFIIVALSLSISPHLVLIDRHLVSIDRTLKDIQKILAGRSDQEASLNPESKEEEEVITTGGGAFLGMAVGGLIGLIGGPIGVIIGGLIGALVGNQLEYESIKAEREKRKISKLNL